MQSHQIICAMHTEKRPLSMHNLKPLLAEVLKFFSSRSVSLHFLYIKNKNKNSFPFTFSCDLPSFFNNINLLSILHSVVISSA